MARIFTAGVWPATIHFTQSLKEYQKLFLKYSGHELSEGCNDALGLAWHKDGRFIIGVFDGTLKTLAHEMGHCAIDILNHAGAGDWRKDDNQEQFCYLIGWLIDVAAPLVTKGK